MVLRTKEANKSTDGKKPSCNICKGTKDSKYSMHKELICGHKFHIRCLTPWLIKTKSCPTCKIPVNQEELQQQQDYCSICLDTGHTGYVKRQKKLSCGHKFHLLCLNSWLKVANTCPMCRKQVRQFGRHQSQEVLQDRHQGIDIERPRQQEPQRGLQQQQTDHEIRQQQPERQGLHQELEVPIQQQQLHGQDRQLQSQERPLQQHAEEQHRQQLNLWQLMRTIPTLAYERIVRLFHA